MSKWDGRDVGKLYAWWLMPLPLVIHLGAYLADQNGAFFSRWIESESGVIENATVIVLILAVLFSLIAAYRLWKSGRSLLAGWFLLVALVCFGFGGEEVSWGQHWLGWESPTYFAENNRQGETNFHNFDIQFGRLVKTILTLMIIVGGLIWPLTRKEPNGLKTDFASIAGTYVCIPAAAFVLGVRLIERCKTWFDLEWVLLAVNLKELQELYIAIFLLIYCWSIKIRTSLLS